jgi:hypothetical protein
LINDEIFSRTKVHCYAESTLLPTTTAPQNVERHRERYRLQTGEKRAVAIISNDKYSCISKRSKRLADHIPCEHLYINHKIKADTMYLGKRNVINNTAFI